MIIPVQSGGGYNSQYDRPACAGDVDQIPGNPIERSRGEEGEARCLLGLVRDAKFIDPPDRNARQFPRKHGDEQRVVSPATAKDYFPRHFGKETPVSIGD
jgi:hypothetical protein